MVIILIANHRLSSSSVVTLERGGTVSEVSFKLLRSILVLCFFCSDMVELRFLIPDAPTGLRLRIRFPGSE